MCVAKLILTLSLSLLLLPVKAQSAQDIRFYVNAIKFIGPRASNNLEPLCEGFYVSISSDKFNIGDEFDLTITKREYEAENQITFYWVEDRAKEDKICAIALAVDKRGERFIRASYCNPDGSVDAERGIQFHYWDYVANYELWRLLRSRRN